MRTDITGNQMSLPDGNVNHFFIGELQLQRLNRAPRGTNRLDTAVKTESVIQMNRKISDFDIRHIFELGARCLDKILLHLVGSADAVFAAETRGEKFAFCQEQSLLFREHHSAGNMKPLHGKLVRFGNAVFAQPFGDMLEIGILVCGKDDLHAVFKSMSDEFGGKLARNLRHRIALLFIRACAERGRNADAGTFRLPAVLNAVDFRFQDMHGTEFFLKRLPVLRRSAAAILLDRLCAVVGRLHNKRTAGRVVGKIKILIRPLDLFAAGTGNDFAGIDLPDGASVIGRVFAQGIDLISEEFDADRKFHSGRKNIENAAAFGKFAGRGGLRLVIVTEGDKTFDELCHIDGVAAMQNDSGSLEFVRIWSR